MAVAGKYWAPDLAEREANLEQLRAVADEVTLRGHEPVIGLDRALPVLDCQQCEDDGARWQEAMRISLEEVLSCDCMLLVSESRDALTERDAMLVAGKPVYNSLDDLPTGTQTPANDLRPG